MTSYEQGFISKCGEYNIDPTSLIKQSQRTNTYGKATTMPYVPPKTTPPPKASPPRDVFAKATPPPRDVFAKTTTNSTAAAESKYRNDQAAFTGVNVGRGPFLSLTGGKVK
jgi:hypothetical protein